MNETVNCPACTEAQKWIIKHTHTHTHVIMSMCCWLNNRAGRLHLHHSDTSSGCMVTHELMSRQRLLRLGLDWVSFLFWVELSGVWSGTGAFFPTTFHFSFFLINAISKLLMCKGLPYSWHIKCSCGAAWCLVCDKAVLRMRQQLYITCCIGMTVSKSFPFGYRKVRRQRKTKQNCILILTPDWIVNRL